MRFICSGWVFRQKRSNKKFYRKPNAVCVAFSIHQCMLIIHIYSLTQLWTQNCQNGCARFTLRCAANAANTMQNRRQLSVGCGMGANIWVLHSRIKTKTMNKWTETNKKTRRADEIRYALDFLLFTFFVCFILISFVFCFFFSFVFVFVEENTIYFRFCQKEKRRNE